MEKKKQIWLDHKKLMNTFHDYFSTKNLTIDDFKGSGYYKISDSKTNETIRIYSDEVFAMYISKGSFDAIETDTKAQISLKSDDYLKAYFEGFKSGLNEFETKFKISPEVLFSNNADAIVQNLIRKGFGDVTTLIYGQWTVGGWQGKAGGMPIDITTTNQFENLGKYAGLITALENYMDEYPTIFEKYNQLLKPAPASESAPKAFTGSKIINVYDPIKVHKEFKKELKCDYNTFKAWFVDSVICDKKMSWKYDNENKTQLRSFIYVLCGGWMPKETNTAFKISVDSNVRECNLNSNLLQRIEKCMFK
jgi:hypothetical protein